MIEKLLTIADCMRIPPFFSRCYIHRAMSDAKFGNRLIAHKRPMHNRRSGEEWVTTRAEFDAWQARAQANKQHKSNPVIRVSADNFDKVQAFIASLEKSDN